MGNNSTPVVLLENVEKASKCCCYITYKNSDNKTTKTSGFFMKLENSKLKSGSSNNHSEHFLLTNYRDISRKLIEEKNEINIEMKSGKKFSLKLNNSKRLIKFYEEKLDTTIIEMKESDDFFNDIDYFEYENKNLTNFNNYESENIFLIQYPNEEKPYISIGKITKIKEEKIYEFKHNAGVKNNSRGAPIIRSKDCKLIGIHKRYDGLNNIGVFIGQLILDEEIKEKNRLAKQMKYNYIIQGIKFKSVCENLELLDMINMRLEKIDDISDIKGYVQAPDNSPYKNGIFKFNIKFNEFSREKFDRTNDIEWMEKPPEILFQTKIFHFEVFPDNGHVCTYFFKRWEKGRNLLQILFVIYEFFLLYETKNPYSGYSYRNFPPNYDKEFFDNCHLWVQKYALKEFPKIEYSFNSEDNIFRFIREDSDDKCVDVINIINKKKINITYDDSWTFWQFCECLKYDFNLKDLAIVAGRNVYLPKNGNININFEDIKKYTTIILIPESK